MKKRNARKRESVKIQCFRGVMGCLEGNAGPIVREISLIVHDELLLPPEIPSDEYPITARHNGRTHTALVRPGDER
jgi:hypothetical protein